MTVLAGITARAAWLFVLVVLTQIGGSSLLAKTDGLRAPGWTALCLGIYVLSFWALATLLREGAPLGMLMPLLAAVVPIAVIAVGIVVYGETASALRIGMLVVACGLVGYAGTLP